MLSRLYFCEKWDKTSRIHLWKKYFNSFLRKYFTQLASFSQPITIQHTARIRNWIALRQKVSGDKINLIRDCYPTSYDAWARTQLRVTVPFFLIFAVIGAAIAKKCRSSVWRVLEELSLDHSAIGKTKVCVKTALFSYSNYTENEKNSLCFTQKAGPGTSSSFVHVKKSEP